LLSQPHSGFVRIPYTQRCRLTRVGRDVSAVLCNMSAQGVYVTLDAIPEAGEIVRLAFPLPGSHAPVEAHARVVWRNLEEPRTLASLPPGCGLRFEALPAADALRILALIEECKRLVPMGLGATPPRSGNVRVPYAQRCRVRAGDGERAAVLCNLSVVGAYVTLDPPLASRERVNLAFLLPGDAAPFRSDATVAWVNDDEPRRVDSLAPGCGLRFDALAAHERQRLERVVLDYCGGAAAAGPETAPRSSRGGCRTISPFGDTSTT
jgi:uncharacterized protein (TIGR02266 family)